MTVMMQRMIDRLNEISTSYNLPFKRGALCFEDYNYSYYNKQIL